MRMYRTGGTDTDIELSLYAGSGYTFECRVNQGAEKIMAWLHKKAPSLLPRDIIKCFIFILATSMQKRVRAPNAAIAWLKIYVTLRG